MRGAGERGAHLLEFTERRVKRGQLFDVNTDKPVTRTGFRTERRLAGNNRQVRPSVPGQ